MIVFLFETSEIRSWFLDNKWPILFVSASAAFVSISAFMEEIENWTSKEKEIVVAVGDKRRWEGTKELVGIKNDDIMADLIFRLGSAVLVLVQESGKIKSVDKNGENGVTIDFTPTIQEHKIADIMRT